MRTWTGFFVRQYRTKLSKRIKPYLDSKKLNLDDWLMSVKHGRRGDILLVYILSIMKGLHTCIHLRNGITWCTLRAVPVHHTELMERCDIHLGYFGFGIFLQLIKRKLPIVLGTIKCDNPDTLNELLATCHNQVEKSAKAPQKTASTAACNQSQLPHLSRELTIAAQPKGTASAAAGSPSQLPRLSRELTISARSKGIAYQHVKSDNPVSPQLIGTTAATSADISVKTATLSKRTSQTRPSLQARPSPHKTATQPVSTSTRPVSSQLIGTTTSTIISDPAKHKVAVSEYHQKYKL